MYFGVWTVGDEATVMNMFAGTKFSEIMMSDSALAGIATASSALVSYLLI